MAVGSLDGAVRLTGMDKGYWNVVSIHGPQERKAHLPWAKTIHYSCFDDTENEHSAVARSAKAADIAGIFGFIRRLGSGPDAGPLMIHCQLGLSRSPAVAMSWIYGCLPPTGDRIVRAIDLLLELRSQAKPNRLVLALGLAQFMALEEARQIADLIVSEPRLGRDRFRVLPYEPSS